MLPNIGHKIQLQVKADIIGQLEEKFYWNPNWIIVSIFKFKLGRIFVENPQIIKYTYNNHSSR